MLSNRMLTEACLVGLLGAGICGQTLGQDPAAILKKAKDNVQNAKTYQATVYTDSSMGQMGSISATMEVKSLSDGRFSMRTTPRGKATGVMASMPSASAAQVVDDGKDKWIYMQVMNGYRKSPSTSKGINSIVAQMVPEGAYKMLAPSTVDGVPVHVIQVVPNADRPGTKIRVVVYIDKSTGRTKRLESAATMGAGVAAPAPMTMKVAMTIKRETLNAPIPAGAFRFTLPKGAKEIPDNMLGGMGGPPAGAPNPRGK